MSTSSVWRHMIASPLAITSRVPHAKDVCHVSGLVRWRWRRALMQRRTAHVRSSSNSTGSSENAPLDCADSCFGPVTVSTSRKTISISMEREPLSPSGLYVVGTPIGHLQDVSIRALRTLQCADFVLAEDTRHSRRLLSRYGIKAEMVSFHEHNEQQREASVLDRLRGGQSAALISDAGTPGISDPGASLIAACVSAGIPVLPIPGPCAAIASLVASGLPTTSFLFLGFLPPKQAARRKRLAELSMCAHTMVFYVPPHSASAVLSDVASCLGSSRRISLGREITKVHEEYLRGAVEEVLEALQGLQEGPKGEMTLVVEGAEGKGEDAMTAEEREEALRERIRTALEEGLSASAAAKRVARETPWAKRNEVYSLATDMSKSS